MDDLRLEGRRRIMACLYAAVALTVLQGRTFAQHLPPVAQPAANEAEIAAALGVPADYVGYSSYYAASTPPVAPAAPAQYRPQAEYQAPAAYQSPDQYPYQPAPQYHAAPQYQYQDQYPSQPQYATQVDNQSGAVSAPRVAETAAIERLPYDESLWRMEANAVRRLPSTDDPILTSDGWPYRLTAAQEPGATAPAAGDGAAGAAGQQQQQQPIGRAPVNNKMQFLRTQDVLLDPGAWQFDTGFAYALFDNDFTLPITSGGNVVDVTEAHLRRRILFTPLALRYGWSENIQVYGFLPVGYSNTQLSTIGASDSTDTGGLGDLNAGLNFHLCHGEGESPDVIATLGFTAPTGKFSAPLFGLVPGSNLGQGFWAMNGQLLFIHQYDPIVVFYGGGYRHLFEREFNGVLFSPGEQISYQLGVGFAVNDRVTLSTALLGFYITDTKLEHINIPGTNIEPISMRFAATIARNCRIIEPYATIGMTDYAPAVTLGLTVTFY